MHGIDFIRAQDEVRTTVASDSFEVHYDVDGITQRLWDAYGHFDFDLIDADLFWSIVANHETTAA